MKRTLLAALTLTACLLCGLAEARQVTPAERTQLASTVAEFTRISTSNDPVGLVDSTPPRILRIQAARSGVGVDAFRSSQIERVRSAMSNRKQEGFAMDVANAKFRELPDGQPYALMPTWRVTTGPDGAKLRIDWETLALLDSGRWFLFNPSTESQITMLIEAYPQFKGVAFAQQRTTPVAKQ